MKPLESALRGIGVEPAERSLFGWGMLVLFLVGAASYAVLNAWPSPTGPAGSRGCS
jgi:hypothetical protein